MSVDIVKNKPATFIGIFSGSIFSSRVTGSNSGHNLKGLSLLESLHFSARKNESHFSISSLSILKYF